MASRSTRKRGSKAYWPRVRAKSHRAVVNSWDSQRVSKESNFLGFPGYKVSMMHVSLIDNFSNTLTKGTEISMPVTIVECPPIKVLSLRLYNLDEFDDLQVAKEVSIQVKDKNLSRTIDLQKKSQQGIKLEELKEFAKENAVDQVRAKVMTEPYLTSIGKKAPEVMELAASGPIEEQINFIYSKLSKEIKASDVLNAGELVDSHGITKGKGFQGAVKRFGVKLTAHKSEKKRRHAGNLGAWTPSRVSHTIPLPGQHGFHKRTEWNKWIIKISNKVDEINPKEGFRRYGYMKNEYMIIKGSLQGPKKRMITLVKSIRPNLRYPKVAPEIVSIRR